ncbi:SRPBCC family protein [Mangrovimonas xylaniphaga]|uniref:SRPBCC family protein n=1 Tax=Mangrovimonas xylaniphaga TaxID=1645915 RepID=UPI0006B4D6C6|nr:SRPBCC family protein [Mangrovimonas xylaniphaga]
MDITVETTINAPIELVWDFWTSPEHITHWNFASDTWCCPKAENDVRPGGGFSWRMEAKDGSMGFDFEGMYQEVIPLKLITSKLLDARKVSIHFTTKDNLVTVKETFESENTNPIDLQRSGWQAILDNFKKHVESHKD